MMGFRKTIEIDFSHEKITLVYDAGVTMRFYIKSIVDNVSVFLFFMVKMATVLSVLTLHFSLAI